MTIGKPRDAVATDARPSLDEADWERAVRLAVAEHVGGAVDGIGPDDSFIGLGMDSLAMMRIAARWQNEGIEVAFADLAARPTLSGWSGVLARADSNSPPRHLPVGPVDPAEPFPLTAVQQAYWIGRRAGVELGGVTCHAYFEFGCPNVDPDRLDRALAALTGRHGMLRARFLDDGRQQILPPGRWPGLTVDDLRDLDDGRRDRRLMELRDTLSHRSPAVDRGEVFGARLALLPAGRSRLFIDIDLLVADVLSVQIVLSDLAALYARPEAALPDIGIDFPTYLAEQQSRRDPGTARAYWQRRLPELPHAPQLPLATDPGRIGTPRFVRRSGRLTADEWRRLRDRAHAHGLTSSMAVVTAFAQVLAKWSGRPKLLLNLPLFNRRSSHPGVPHMVADFTDLVLLDIDLSADDGFAARARRVQERFQQNTAHADYSGVDVLRDLARARDGAFTAPVVFASNLGRELVDEGFRTHLGDLDWMISQTPQVWLDHQLYEDAQGMEAVWDAVDALFPQGLLDDMFDAYLELLRELAAKDADWSRAAPVALPDRQLQVREQANATLSPMPSGLLHEGVFDQARRTPERPAVIGGDRVLTYGELVGRAAAVAGALQAHGCAPGDRVGVLMDKGWEQVVAVLGILLAGGAYVPIGPEQPPERRDRMLADAGIRQILTQSWLAVADSEELRARRCLPVDALPQADPGTSAGRCCSPDDLAYVIYTSGSTGTPKGVMISHRSALNTVEDVNRRHRITGTDRVLGLAGLGFDLSVYDVFGPLAVGAALVLPDPERRGDPSHWADLIARHGVTVWNSVPAQLQMLDHFLGDRADSGPPALPTLRLALLSGDWIPVTLPDSLRTKLPSLTLVSLGGATEAAIWSIEHPIGKVEGDWRSIPYGKPLANQRFQVLDDLLRAAPEWVPGELYIAGEGLALGYLGDPGKTAERFVRHPVTGERLYRTGDLGRYLPDGSIEFLGRTDSQVKIRGHRIELTEIEAVLERHPDVADARVVVDGRDVLDRRLAAFVTPAREFGSETESGVEPDLRTIAHAEASRIAAVTGPDGLDAFARTLRRAVLVSIADALHRLLPGAYAPGVPGLTWDEAAAQGGVDSRHHRLLRRWLTALAREGMIRHDQLGGRYNELCAVTDTGVEEAWDQVLARPDHRLWPEEVLRLFRTSAGQLPALMRGEVDQVHLLFPEGSSRTAIAAFTENLAVRYLNRAVSAVLGELARRHPGPGPLRILEIGAGVGGTSADAFEALAGHDVEYLFTDVSAFFLTEARQRFADRDFVHYALFDMDKDPAAQGLRPNSFDVVVAANVLHNTRDAGELLARLAELLAPQGHLVFTELTDEIPEMLISMEFLAGAADDGSDFRDTRAGSDRFLLTDPEWRNLLRAAGATDVFGLPGDEDDLVRLGQRLLVARFKSDRRRVSTDGLIEHLTRHLPGYMIPEQLEILDAIPLTGNGKVDHTALRDRLGATGPGSRTRGHEPPRGELEVRIARLWADCLELREAPRDHDFFSLGGDSLLVTRLIGRLRADIPELAPYDFDALLRAMMDRATVASLAARASRQEQGAEPKPGVGPELDSASDSGPEPEAGSVSGTGPEPEAGPVSGAGPR
ncbi:amino acid adenylation domain-containing protein [Streptomyces prunicolor]|uniref:non-ribosomal peptide synthetase n=1 Tax=Streptomyces prunicolor TaxID=67348 RepID=UPI00370FC561